jgi:hypothetical protein
MCSSADRLIIAALVWKLSAHRRELTAGRPTIIVVTAKEWIEVTDPNQLYAAVDHAELDAQTCSHKWLADLCDCRAYPRHGPFCRG